MQKLWTGQIHFFFSRKQYYFPKSFYTNELSRVHLYIRIILRLDDLAELNIQVYEKCLEALIRYFINRREVYAEQRIEKQHFNAFIVEENSAFVQSAFERVLGVEDWSAETEEKVEFFFVEAVLNKTLPENSKVDRFDFLVWLFHDEFYEFHSFLELLEVLFLVDLVCDELV